MSYLIAVPGIRQEIEGKIFTIKRMYSDKQDAIKCVNEYKESGKWNEVREYTRIKEGKKFGKHPYCVAVRGAIS